MAARIGDQFRVPGQPAEEQLKEKRDARIQKCIPKPLKYLETNIEP
jgi:hypothetical protein